MAVITEIKQIGLYFWHARWIGTPPFRVIRDGRPYGAPNLSVYEMIVQGDDILDAPIIEVLETGESSIFAPYQSWAMLQWRNTNDAESYHVQKYIGGEWVTIAAPLRNNSEPYVQYDTTELTDGTEYQYRVIGRDRLGNLSAVEGLTFTHHRIPPAPDIEFTWDEGTLKFAAGVRT